MIRETVQEIRELAGNLWAMLPECLRKALLMNVQAHVYIELREEGPRHVVGFWSFCEVSLNSPAIKVSTL